MHACMYIYINIYIQRERETEAERRGEREFFKDLLFIQVWLKSTEFEFLCSYIFLWRVSLLENSID